MNGIRAFAAYLGLVWFFLGFANFLTLMDRVKESFEQPGAAEAVELRLEGAEKALEVAEKEWEAKLEITDQNLEKIEKEIEMHDEAEDVINRQLAEVELARVKAMRVGQEELMVKAIESAKRRIEEIEATQISVMDWVRALGATAVGVLLIAFAWRGPPLRWDDVLADDASEPAPAPSKPFGTHHPLRL